MANANHENRTDSNSSDKNTVKEYFALGEVFTYFFRKKPDKKPNFNLRMMHGINKISIVVFLLGVIYLIIKNILR